MTEPLKKDCKSCYLVGSTALLIHCAEHLLANNFKIVCICTYDQQVLSWAAKNNISTQTNFSIFCKQIILNRDANYLFSIVNFEIIPVDVISNISIAAINFHDANICKYRGSNSISWSIFNGESEHGISWHIIDEKVDAGYPVVQRTFMLDQEETAETLEIKSLENAIEGFRSLINILPNANNKQLGATDLGAFYSKSKLPPQHGFLLSNQSLESNSRLLRGLDFGAANNYFDLPKIYVEEKIYFVVEYMISNANKDDIIAHKYVCFIKFENIKIYLLKLIDLSGNIVDNLGSKKEEQIASLPEKLVLEQYATAWRNGKRDEHFWQNQLKMGNASEYIEPLIIKPENFCSAEIVFENELLDAILTLLPTWDIKLFCLSFAAMVYREIIGSNTLYIGLINDRKLQDPFYSTHGVISHTHAHTDKFKDSLSNLYLSIEQATKTNFPLEGFYQRHNFDLQNINLYINLNPCLINETSLSNKSIHISPGEATNRLHICGKSIHLKWFQALAHIIPKLLNNFVYTLQNGFDLQKIMHSSFEYQDAVINQQYNAMPYNHAMLPSKFEHIASEFAANIAIHDGDNSLTYKELDSLSDKFASYIKTKMHYAIDCNIAILSQKTIEYIVAILGCIKAGYAFVPISCRSSSNKIQSIIAAANCQLLLVDKIDEANEFKIPVEDLSQKNYLHINNYDIENIQSTLSYDTIAYIMFTSGSSGEPKGVMVTHKNLSSFLDAIQQNLKVSSFDSWLSITDISFDISLLECFLPLLHGATLIVLPAFIYEHIDKTVAVIKKYKPSIMQTTPSIWNFLIEYLIDDQHKFSHILCGGEDLPSLLAINLQKISFKLWNCYGPTETTIWSSMCLLNAIENLKTPAIGHPLINNKFYLIDHETNALEIGAIGEIVIGGDSVSNGYLSSKTDNFIHINSQRTYRTGDLGFYDNNGIFYYLGRNDSQLKINGQRIEVDELNYAARNHFNIKDAYTYVYKQASKSRIFLLVILCKEYPEAVDEIYQSINSKLFQEIPVTIIPILTPPMNSSGKISQALLKSLVDQYLEKDPVNSTITDANYLKLFSVFKNVCKIDIPENANLISLGLTSLDLVKVLSAINNSFNVKISLIEIYRDPTAQSIMKAIQNYRYKHGHVETNKKSEFDLTPIQNGIYFQCMQNRSGIYNIPILIKLNKNLDPSRIEQAIGKASKNFVLLQCKLMLSDKKLQWVTGNTTTVVQQVNIAEEHTDDFFTAEATRLGFIDFDLHDSLLWKAIIWICPHQNYLFLNFHHIIADAYSINRFIAEIANAYINSNDHVIESEWFNNTIVDPDFWSKYLADYPEFLDLEVIKRRTLKHTQAHAENHVIVKSIPKDIVTKICSLAKNEHTTPFNLFVASMALTLSSLCQQTKMSLGIPVSPRAKFEATNSFVPLVNVLPFIIEIKQTNFTELFATCKDIITSLLQNSDADLQNIVKTYDLPLTTKLFPYQVVLNYESIADFDLHIDTLKSENIPIFQNICKFDLMLTFRKNDELFDLVCQFDEDQFGKEEIVNMLDYYLHILTKCLNMPELPLAMVSTPAADCIEIYEKINNTTQTYDFTLDLKSLFNEQLIKWSSKKALYDKNGCLTYAELENISNKIKYSLQSLGVVENDRVIIYGDKSVTFVAAMLGVIKCLATYIPQDILQVIPGLKNVANQSKARLLINLSNEDLTELTDYCIVIKLADLLTDNYNLKSDNSPIKTNDLIANIIFTSGTTNEPKGVIISHRAIALLVKSQGFLKLGPEDCVISCSSISFDASTYDIWGCLLNGASLYLCDRYEVLDLNIFKNICDNYKPTISFFSSGLFEKMVGLDVNLFKNFSKVLVGGDVISSVSIKAFLSYFTTKRPILYNIYGPTEATVFTAAYKITPESNELTNIPIGQPIPFTRCYVLDKSKKPCHINVKGELYIAGDRLAEGYLNTEQTREKFNEIEIFGVTERLYCTGDIVKLDPNGNIVFIGRNDRQIKRNGFRIELDFIEKSIEKMPNINKAVISLGNSKQKLYLFVQTSIVTENEVFLFLNMNLPEYMWPSQIIIVDEMPLTKNGKVNTKLLVEQFIATNSNQNVKISIDDRQLYLFAQIWKKILNVEIRDLNDDYFQLGGDSIGCLLIISKCREIHLFLEPIDFYECRKFGAIYNKAKSKLGLPIKSNPMVEIANLTPIQNWFLTTFTGDINHFNQSRYLKLNNDIDIRLLEKSLLHTINQHKELFLLFIKTDNKWQQKINQSPNDLKIDLLFFNNIHELKSEISFMQNSLNIEAGKLFKIVLAQVQSERYLAIIVHHLVIDTVSWRIFLQELEDAYQNFANNSPFINQDNMHSVYLNWADKFSNNEYKNRTAIEPILPVRKNCVHYRTQIDVSELLTILARYDDISIFEVVLAAFVNTYCTITNRDHVNLILESHGRDIVSFPDIDITNTFGWFTFLFTSCLSKPQLNNADFLITLKNDYEAAKATAKETFIKDFNFNLGDTTNKVCFNFHGRSNLDYKLFSLLPNFTDADVSDENEFLYEFELNCAIFDQQLELNITGLQTNDLCNAAFCELYQSTLVDIQQLLARSTAVNTCAKSNFKLNPLQQAYWFGRQGVYEYGNIPPHLHLVFKLKGLDLKKFGNALNETLAVHDMLRVKIIDEDLQFIRPALSYTIPTTFFDYDEEKYLNSASFSNLRTDIFNYFSKSDLEHLFYIHVTRCNYDIWYIHFAVDLMLTDIIGLIQWFKDIELLYYNQLIQAPSINFKEYYKLVNSKAPYVYQQDREYWAALLSDLPDLPNLPLQKQSSSNNLLKRFSQKLDFDTQRGLTQLANKLGVTLTSVIGTAFVDILRKWSGTNRFIINIMYVNRLADDDNATSIIGPCASTFPFISDSVDNEDFAARVSKFQKQIWTSISHNSISGVELIRDFINKKRNSINNAALPITFSSGLGAISNSGYDFKIFENEVYSELQAPYLILDAHVREDAQANVLIDWDCLVDAFKPGVIPGMFSTYIDYLKNLSNMVEDISIPKADLDLIAITNQSKRENHDLLLHQGFINAVQRHPSKIALITAEGKLTYNELFLIAQHNANNLFKLGVSPGSMVPIVLGKGLEQIVAVLSVLLLGAVFVPLDLNIPKNRLNYILNKIKAKIVITRLDIDQKTYQVLMQCESNESPIYPLSDKIDPESLAYIIFTSGTTGEPKGVMITHKAANNTIEDINHRFRISENDVVFGISQLSFDLSIYDIFGTFAVGATLVLPLEKDKHNPKIWQNLIDSNLVTIWNSTPGLYELYIDWLTTTASSNSGLRMVLLSGDFISVQLLKNSKSIIPECKLYSLGGATEASIWSIYYPIDDIDKLAASVPYGKPLSNQNIYILDYLLELCPIWVTGEIYIGGAGIALGYFDEDELTRKAFIHHPQTGERLYKTGDLGRLLPDGNVEILGRIDSQVKVRGFRVEIEEIEHQLNQHPDVKNNTIVFRDSLLAAFVVTSSPNIVSKDDLEQYLQKWLPTYMIPTKFYFVEQIPFTANGKVDRKQLINSIIQDEEQPGITSKDFTNNQLLISNIWSDVLQVTISSPHENFFELGGTSLSAVKILNQVQAKFNINSSLSKLFSAPTVAGMSDFVFQPSNSVTNIFLSLNKSMKNRPTIFLIHPIGGMAFCYQTLVKSLEDYNVIGIQSPGDYSTNNINSLMDLAAYYAEKITAFIPAGQNIHIGGWSLGALLAIEVSKILADKYNIQYLLLIDPPKSTFLPNVHYSHKKEYYYEFALDLLDGNQALLTKEINSLQDVFNTITNLQKFKGMFSLETLSALSLVYRSHSHWLAAYKINRMPKNMVKKVDIFLANESIGTAKPHNLIEFFRDAIGAQIDLKIFPVSHYQIVDYLANKDFVYG